LLLIQGISRGRIPLEYLEIKIGFYYQQCSTWNIVELKVREVGKVLCQNL